MTIIDEVIEQIKEDLQFGDLTAIEALLREIPVESLTAFFEEG